MKVLLIQHVGYLNGTGGTEKICSLLANYLVSNKHEVVIATNDIIDGRPMFELDERVTVENIYDNNVVQILEKPIYDYKGKNPISWLKFKIQKKIAKNYNRNVWKKKGSIKNLFVFNLNNRSVHWNEYIKSCQPDLIITMSTSSLLEITYKKDYKIPIINSVNGRPDYDYSSEFCERPKFLMNLLIYSYRHLSGIQVLFESYVSYLPLVFKGVSRVINNPVVQIKETDIVDHFKKKERYKIVHIGRLDIFCKQQHIAIDVFSSIANQFPNWDLEFWGEGDDFDKLNKRVKKLNLSHRIFFRGFTNDPMKILREADVFIFPSLFEGFGLALVEAMAVGLPSIGFIYCSGVNELIQHGITGYLVNDVQEMRTSLLHLMTNPSVRQEMGKNANKFSNAFSHNQMYDGWQKLINEVLIMNKNLNCVVAET